MLKLYSIFFLLKCLFIILNLNIKILLKFILIKFILIKFIFMKNYFYIEKMKILNNLKIRLTAFTRGHTIYYKIS
jgi:hypothetical protein